MLSFSPQVRIFLARSPVDFRKAHDGLCAIVRNALAEDPMSGDWFVFFNKRYNRIKLLVWDRSGFWLHYKRMEKGTFQRWPKLSEQENKIELQPRELSLLLEGIDIKSTKIRKHFATPIRLQDRRRDDGPRRAANGH